VASERIPDLGARGEDAAADYLARRGLRVVARNWRLPAGELRGELDLVCWDGRTLVVVEVKTRSSERYGGGLAAVTPAKQAQLRRLGAAYLRSVRPRARAVRFDVVAVAADARGALTITHLADAF
jgi:putative endonuclease